MTILAIDDDKDMLALYQVILAGLGQMRTALNLTEARAQMEGVDLIILDFNLEQDKETIQEILPELKKVAPVLLCSGIQDLGVPVIGAEHGIAGYWNKAADHDKLRLLVKSMFKKVQ
jgi:DNA-binding NtrC family response regulator